MSTVRPLSAPRFCHLHLHTAYSLLDGACKIKPLLEKAAKSGMPAVAMTDHGNLFGAIKFYQAALSAGVKPILGCEVYVATGSRLEKKAGHRKPYTHLILLAENNTGWRNLVKLVSAGYLDGFYYKPRIDKEILRTHSEGLIGLSACLGGEVAQHILRGRLEEAEASALEYQDILGKGNYFLELQDHGIEEQDQVNKELISLSEKLDIPLVATNDVHYLNKDDREAHNVLICIGTGKTVHEQTRMVYTPEHYFKTMEEMVERFSWRPEAIENTMRIAERCQVELDLKTNHLPRFNVPEGETLDSYLAKVCREGLQERMVDILPKIKSGSVDFTEQDYQDRLELELKVIANMGFPGYFLIVWDFIRYAREAGIPVGPGRGSAAGSLVSYALKITNVDPLEYDLLFERFLNPDRVSMPDIDIDFCIRGREKVIEYVVQKYGEANVSQIITFGEMKARSAVRDVARALAVPLATADKIAKLIPAELKMTIDLALKVNPILKKLYDDDPEITHLIDIARRLEGMKRNAGTHAAGVVISPKPIIEFCPVYKADRKGSDVAMDVATQFAKDEVEAVGLIKMDFLGLRNLTIIDDCLKAIEKAGLEVPDLEHLPMDDEKTFELFRKARTDGVFQFESSGMKDILRRLGPDKFNDLVILNALFRPGPLGSGMVDTFLDNRSGKIDVVPHPFPEVDAILKPTDGVLVYQEQVMRIANVVGGFTLAQSDELRRAMGKKKADVMKEKKKEFLANAKKRKLDLKVATELFEQMEKFAEYGFNKSHSVAYALVAFQTAYLKAHFPTYYMAALLSSEMDTTDRVVQYIRECKEMGIPILQPDVNTSEVAFKVEGEGIRYGLQALKNLGEGAILSLLEARRAQPNHSFATLHDMLDHIDPRALNKRAMEALIKAGALDSVHPHRSDLFAYVDSAMEGAQKAHRDRETGQEGLFGGGEDDDTLSHIPTAEPWHERDQLRHEKEAMGFYFSGHPLSEFEEEIRSYTSHSLGDLKKEDGLPKKVTVVGLVEKVTPKKSRKGDWYTLLRVEDLEGSAEVLLFRELHESSREWIKEDKAVLISGKPEYDGAKVSIIAEQFHPLEKGRELFASALAIDLPHTLVGDAMLDKIGQVLARHKGQKRVVLNLIKPHKYVVRIRLNPFLLVHPGKELIGELENLVGEGRVKTLLQTPRRKKPA